MIRLGLADDEPLFTMGLAMLLGAQPDMEVVWRAVDGNDALMRNDTDPVDVLLLDVQMPGLDGLAATRELMARGITGRVVILTTFDTDGYVMGAIEAGAAGFLLKNTPPQDLITAIRTVHDGDSVISPGPTRRLLTAVRTGQVSGTLDNDAGAGRHASEDSVEAVRAAEASQQVAALTQREREILALIALGLTNQEICDREWLSMPTVKTHVSHLLSKTGCRDRVQLVLLLCAAVSSTSTTSWAGPEGKRNPSDSAGWYRLVSLWATFRVDLLLGLPCSRTYAQVKMVCWLQQGFKGLRIVAESDSFPDEPLPGADALPQRLCCCTRTATVRAGTEIVPLARSKPVRRTTSSAPSAWMGRGGSSGPPARAAAE